MANNGHVQYYPNAYPTTGTVTIGDVNPYFSPFSLPPLSRDGKKIVEGFKWLDEIVPGGMQLTTREGCDACIVIRVTPCTPFFYKKMKIVEHFPLWARVLHEEENAVAGVVTALELRFDQSRLGDDWEGVRDAYRKFREDDR
jgi:hypothetical protein